MKNSVAMISLLLVCSLGCGVTIASDDKHGEDRTAERINSPEVGDVDSARYQPRENAEYGEPAQIYRDVDRQGERSERVVIESAFATAHYTSQYRDDRNQAQDIDSSSSSDRR